jgi:hypothetical protein
MEGRGGSRGERPDLLDIRRRRELPLSRGPEGSRASQEVANATHDGYILGVTPLLDVHVFVSGDAWQYGESGVRLGNIGKKSRTLWIRIFVPDEVATEQQARRFLAQAFDEASDQAAQS